MRSVAREIDCAVGMAKDRVPFAAEFLSYSWIAVDFFLPTPREMGRNGALAVVNAVGNILGRSGGGFQEGYEASPPNFLRRISSDAGCAS